MENRKNRKLNRLKGYNYSQNGWYFITICIKNRIECLGEIKNKKMKYSQYGDIVLKFWQAIPNYYKNVFLDQWVIMPNHIHGIIIIKNKPVGTEHYSVNMVRTHMIRTEHCSVPTMMVDDNYKKYGLLSKIVKSFKEISLKTIRKNYDDYEFAWQRSYYDHIIRNENSLNKIREYIINNPLKWEYDRNNTENLWI